MDSFAATTIRGLILAVACQYFPEAAHAKTLKEIQGIVQNMACRGVGQELARICVDSQMKYGVYFLLMLNLHNSPADFFAMCDMPGVGPEAATVGQMQTYIDGLTAQRQQCSGEDVRLLWFTFAINYCRARGLQELSRGYVYDLLVQRDCAAFTTMPEFRIDAQAAIVRSVSTGAVCTEDMDVLLRCSCRT